MNLAADLEEVIRKLSETLERIQVTKGFKEVLTPAQLEEVYCYALILATCVTDYLTKVIVYLDAGIDIPSPSREYNVVKSLFDGKEFDETKNAIDTTTQNYKESMGFLTATMTAELLHRNKDERREQILNWL